MTNKKDRTFKKIMLGHTTDFRTICEVIREIYWATENIEVRNKAIEASGMAKKMSKKLARNQYELSEAMDYEEMPKEAKEVVSKERWNKYLEELERGVDHPIPGQELTQITTTKIPNLNTLADVIDRLIVEVNKLSFFENQKREEHAKGAPDAKLITHWDNLSRDCCEYRSMLKNEINRLLAEIVETGEYKTLNELRTFRAPTHQLSELLAERCWWAGSEQFKADLCASLKDELQGEQDDTVE
jgi:hypothetical protein